MTNVMTTNVLLANAVASLTAGAMFLGWARRRMHTGTIVLRARRFPVPNNDRFA